MSHGARIEMTSGLLRHDLSQAACGNDLGCGSQLLPETGDNALDESCIAEHESGLQRLCGISSYRRRWPAEIDFGQFGCPLKKRLRGNSDPGRDGASKKIPFRGYRIEGGCRAEINDAYRPPIQPIACSGIHNPVRAYLAGIVISDGYARIACFINYQRFMPEELLADFHEGSHERRNDGSHGNCTNVCRRDFCAPQKTQYQRAIFILRFIVNRGETPTRPERFSVIQAKGDICISNINCEKHSNPLRITNDDLRLTI